MCSTSRGPPASSRAPRRRSPASPRLRRPRPSTPPAAAAAGRGATCTCAASPTSTCRRRSRRRAGRSRCASPSARRTPGPALGRPLELQRGVGSVELLKSQPLWANMQVTVELAPAVTVRLRLQRLPVARVVGAETARPCSGPLLRRAARLRRGRRPSRSAARRCGSVFSRRLQLLRRRGDDALDVAALGALCSSTSARRTRRAPRVDTG